MYCHRFRIISLEGVWEITTGMSLQTSVSIKHVEWNTCCHPIRHKEFSHTSINEAHMHGSGLCPAGRHRNTTMSTLTHALCFRRKIRHENRKTFALFKNDIDNVYVKKTALAAMSFPAVSNTAIHKNPPTRSSTKTQNLLRQIPHQPPSARVRSCWPSG